MLVRYATGIDTFSMLAKEYNISVERVRQIIKRETKKLIKGYNTLALRASYLEDPFNSPVYYATPDFLESQKRMHEPEPIPTEEGPVIFWRGNREVI